MSALPEELWRRILEIGIETPNSLTFRDLCSLSITCSFLHRLSSDDSLWASLLSSDFPSSSSSASNVNPSLSFSVKGLYKTRFERDRARKLAAHRRAVLRIESQIVEHSRKLKEIQQRSVEETDKMRATVAELSNLHKARQASAALNVWQPEVIRSSHKQIVEQYVVPADARKHALEMEIRLCKQQITGLDKAYKDEKRRLGLAKEQLASIKYHPLQDYSLTNAPFDQSGFKRKKSKTEHNNCKKSG
ncbi:hypothetical protein NMG60_11031107 [Bertholletia excelsa]